MLDNARIQRMAAPWPELIEVSLGAAVLPGAQVAGFLLASRDGTAWLMIGIEAAVVIAMLCLRALGEDVMQWWLVLSAGLLLGAASFRAGLVAEGSDIWYWPIVAFPVVAGLILYSRWTPLVYPLPVFLSAFVASDELTSLARILAAIVMAMFIAFGVVLRRLYHANRSSLA